MPFNNNVVSNCARVALLTAPVPLASVFQLCPTVSSPPNAYSNNQLPPLTVPTTPVGALISAPSVDESIDTICTGTAGSMTLICTSSLAESAHRLPEVLIHKHLR
jgi:hypothetical protein